MKTVIKTQAGLAVVSTRLLKKPRDIEVDVTVASTTVSTGRRSFETKQDEIKFHKELREQVEESGGIIYEESDKL